MRIRKRLPPPSNNLSSDPQLHNSTLLVQQQQQQVHSCPLAQQAKTNSQPSDPPNHPHPPPSNQEPLIKHASQDQKMVLINNNKLDGFGEMIKSNDTWKDGIQCAGARSEAVLPSSSSHQVFGGWFGEDRAIPIKKRRGSLGKRANKDSITKEEEKTMAKMKSKTNKKCVQENGDVEQQAGKESSSKEGIDLNISSDVKKNVKRGSEIMEGSRCSRVNGRGWRCCQQTLVGYSLCEHHLGKGRLRSMNSVRNRAKSKKDSTHEIDRVKPERLQEKKQEIVLLDHDNEGDDDYDEDDDDELVMKKEEKKKKKKIGMVKARSISSLLGLGQRESEVMGDENDKNR